MTVEKAKESIEWVFRFYIPHLEQENRDLYAALSKYGIEGSKLQRRHELRLQAILDVQKRHGSIVDEHGD